MPSNPSSLLPSPPHPPSSPAPLQGYAKHFRSLPEDPWEQLRMGIDAVFR